MVVKIYSTILRIFIVSTFLLPASGNALTKKKIDFVVGIDGDFKAAMSAASNAGGKRFIMFFPNGDYDIGTLTGDKNQQTLFKTGMVSFIGQDNAKTLIYNTGKADGIHNSAMLMLSGNGCYFQDVTIQNKAKIGTGRFTVIDEQCKNTIYKNVRMLSGQDTYYTKGSVTYWEGGEIHGTVDFICGGGDVFFNKVLLWTMQKFAIAAPAQNPKWGYVFSNCTIDGTSDGYSFGRNWNEGRAVFLNTIMKKVVSSAGWISGISGRTNQKLLAEYNSIKPDGSKVSTSGRKIGTILSDSEASKYTIDNVLGSWNPQQYTKQVPAPEASVSGSTLRWNDDENALCWVVFKDNSYFKCVTETSCAISSGDDAKKYTIRAANAMGGLGPIASFVPTNIGGNQKSLNAKTATSFKVCKKALSIEPGTSKNIAVTIYALNGKKALSREYTLQTANEKVEIPLHPLTCGIYILKARYDGAVIIDYITIR